MIHIVEHNYQKEVLVPMTAISNNIDLLCRRDDSTRIQFRNGEICKPRMVRTIHALTPEFETKMFAIYGRSRNITVEGYMRNWYKKLEYKFTSLEFVYIEAHEPETKNVSD